MIKLNFLFIVLCILHKNKIMNTMHCKDSYNNRCAWDIITCPNICNIHLHCVAYGGSLVGGRSYFLVNIVKNKQTMDTLELIEQHCSEMFGFDIKSYRESGSQIMISVCMEQVDMKVMQNSNITLVVDHLKICYLDKEVDNFHGKMLVFKIIKIMQPYCTINNQQCKSRLDNDEECPICFVKNNEFVSLHETQSNAIEHAICILCFNKLSNMNLLHTCPFCRQSIK